MNKATSTPKIKKMKGRSKDFILLDVLPPEYFEKLHIPGAKNATVYEVSFLDQVKELGIKKDSQIVVYDSSSDSLASKEAMRKLKHAGYVNVQELEGGIKTWQKKGYETEGTGSYEELAIPVKNGVYRIDTEKSIVQWLGSSLTGRHDGTLGIKNGELRISKSTPQKATLTIDMNLITNFDISNKKMRGYLEAHLKSDDFFDVENHPQAKIEIKNVSRISKSTPGTQNYLATANLTIKSNTHPVKFPVVFGTTEEKVVTASGSLDFDRTKWGVNYGSGKLYEMLGMHLVNDIININFHLFFEKR